MSILEELRKSVAEGDPEQAAVLARQALEAGLDPLDAINQALVPGIQYTGEQFGCGEMFLPDLMLAAEAMKQALAVLEPEMTRRGARRESLGRVVIGTIQGDIHEIGKNLVATLLSATGFEVFDLGVDVPPMRFAEQARQVGARLVGVSALLTTTMVRQKEVIAALTELGLRGPGTPQVKVMVGGAPVTRRWAEQIGADGHSEDALGAVQLAKSLLGIE
jgi:corrinoid protein of di/trimethylamine methyltransferase